MDLYYKKTKNYNLEILLHIANNYYKHNNCFCDYI